MTTLACIPALLAALTCAAILSHTGTNRRRTMGRHAMPGCQPRNMRPLPGMKMEI